MSKIDIKFFRVGVLCTFEMLQEASNRAGEIIVGRKNSIQRSMQVPNLVKMKSCYKNCLLLM